MTAKSDLVRRHYSAGAAQTDLVARVTRELDALSPGGLSAAQLAGFDQFHVRGLAATAELAELAGAKAGLRVLDAGSGLGGPSRYLAQVHGCRVDGVDLTPDFVAIARLLAERTGLRDRVDYQVGDLAALPFPDAAFDLVWTQHVVMNIADRRSVYREFRRVLKSGGKLAFYDVLASDKKPEILFPVPWSRSGETSCLLTEAETIVQLEDAGLILIEWRDATEAAIEWMSQTRAGPPTGLALSAVLGPGFGEMAANLARNIREGRVRLVMGCFQA